MNENLIKNDLKAEKSNKFLALLYKQIHTQLKASAEHKLGFLSRHLPDQR